MKKINKSKLTEGKKQATRVVIVGMVSFAVIGYGLVKGYEHYKRAENLALPISKMFETKENVVLDGAGKNTPTKDSDVILLEEVNEKPVVYFFYKVGCETCQKNYQELKKAMNNYSGKAPIYFVNVESEVGHNLVEKYRLERASTMVVVNEEGEFVDYVLSYGIDSGTVLATIDTLLNSQ